MTFVGLDNFPAVVVGYRVPRKIRWWFGLFVCATLSGFAIAWWLGSLSRERSRVGETLSRPEAVEIAISATVDGSERFIFTAETVWDDHGQWQRPKDVMFNGQPWEDLSQAPAGWTALAPALELRQASITVRNGRDVIALEPTADGFDLYFADTQMGSARYSVTISIPKK